MIEILFRCCVCFCSVRARMLFKTGMHLYKIAYFYWFYCVDRIVDQIREILPLFIKAPVAPAGKMQKYVGIVSWFLNGFVCVSAVQPSILLFSCPFWNGFSNQVFIVPAYTRSSFWLILGFPQQIGQLKLAKQSQIQIFGGNKSCNKLKNEQVCCAKVENRRN